MATGDFFILFRASDSQQLPWWWVPGLDLWDLPWPPTRRPAFLLIPGAQLVPFKLCQLCVGRTHSRNLAYVDLTVKTMADHKGLGREWRATVGPAAKVLIRIGRAARKQARGWAEPVLLQPTPLFFWNQNTGLSLWKTALTRRPTACAGGANAEFCHFLSFIRCNLVWFTNLESPRGPLFSKHSPNALTAQASITAGSRGGEDRGQGWSSGGISPPPPPRLKHLRLCSQIGVTRAVGSVDLGSNPNSASCWLLRPSRNVWKPQFPCL